MADNDLHQVQLPDSWKGISFSTSADGRIFVTEVPNYVFSSFDMPGAEPQVAGITKGNEIVTVNGAVPKDLAAQIVQPGHRLNSCSKASPPHTIGTVGKFDSPPCASCDFARRLGSQGFDVALTLWIKAVKSHIPIICGIRFFPDAAHQSVAANHQPGKSVELKTDAHKVNANAMKELRSLDDVVSGERWPQQEVQWSDLDNAQHVNIHPKRTLTPEEEKAAILEDAAKLPESGYYINKFLLNLDAPALKVKLKPRCPPSTFRSDVPGRTKTTEFSKNHSPRLQNMHASTNDSGDILRVKVAAKSPSDSSTDESSHKVSCFNRKRFIKDECEADSGGSSQECLAPDVVEGKVGKHRRNEESDRFNYVSSIAHRKRRR